MKYFLDLNEFLTRAIALALLCLYSAAANANEAACNIVRNFTFSSADAATVEVAWNFDKAPESGVIVKENVSDGWTLSFDAAANPAVKAVKQDGDTWSFLVGRETLASAGSFTYSLSRMSAQGGNTPSAIVSGSFLTSALSGVSIANVARGLENDPPLTASQAQPIKEPVITGFVVMPGAHPRATITWSGSGTNTVYVQWKKSLVDDAPQPRSDVGARDSRDGSSWTTIGVVNPSSDGPRPRDAGEETFSANVEAREGFYRLLIKTNEE